MNQNEMHPFGFDYHSHRRESLYKGGKSFAVIDGKEELRRLWVNVNQNHLNPKENENFLVHLPSLICTLPQLDEVNFDCSLVSISVDLHVLPGLRQSVRNAIATRPKLNRIHCWLSDPVHAEPLAVFILQCKNIQHLSIDQKFRIHDKTNPKTYKYLEPIKRAIRDHPTLKSFVLHGHEYLPHVPSIQRQCSWDLLKLILELPNIEEMEFKNLRFDEADYPLITAAVEAHDNMKTFGIIETKEMGMQEVGFFADHLRDRIINKLAINRAKAMLGDNPTFQNWEATLTAFCHYPAVDHLLYKGVLGGGGLWADAAFDLLKAREKKRQEEGELGKEIQWHNRKEIHKRVNLSRTPYPRVNIDPATGKLSFPLY